MKFDAALPTDGEARFLKPENSKIQFRVSAFLCNQARTTSCTSNYLKKQSGSRFAFGRVCFKSLQIVDGCRLLLRDGRILKDVVVLEEKFLVTTTL
jgi:hypothetical protein